MSVRASSECRDGWDEDALWRSGLQPVGGLSGQPRTACLGAFEGDEFLGAGSEEEYAKSILHQLRVVDRKPGTSVPSMRALPHGEPGTKSRRTREVFSCNKVYVATTLLLLFPPRLRLPPTAHIRSCDLRIPVDWQRSTQRYTPRPSFSSIWRV
jgi:hypothetical protein